MRFPLWKNLFVQIAPQSAVSSGVTEDTTLAPSIPCSLRKVENALRKMAAVSIRHKNVFFFILFYLEFYRFCCFTESSFVRFYNISGQFYIIRSLCFLKGVFCFFLYRLLFCIYRSFSWKVRCGILLRLLPFSRKQLRIFSFSLTFSQQLLP